MTSGCPCGPAQVICAFVNCTSSPSWLLSVGGEAEVRARRGRRGALRPAGRGDAGRRRAGADAPGAAWRRRRRGGWRGAAAPSSGQTPGPASPAPRRWRG